MKTFVSIPDEIFESADKLADGLGLSRSEVYTRALAEYVDRHHGAAVTARLDRVHSVEPRETLDKAIRRAQARSVVGEE